MPRCEEGGEDTSLPMPAECARVQRGGDKDKAFQVGAGHSEKRVLTSKTKHLRVAGNVHRRVPHTATSTHAPQGDRCGQEDLKLVFEEPGALKQSKQV